MRHVFEERVPEVLGLCAVASVRADTRRMAVGVVMHEAMVVGVIPLEAFAC